MPAQTISDTFLARERIQKKVSLKELEEKRKELEANLGFTPLQKLTRGFNRNALVSFVKSYTIGAYRLNKMPVHGNNLLHNTFDAKGTMTTLEKLGRDTTLGLEQDNFVNGLAIASMLEIVAPRTPIDSKSVTAQTGRVLLEAFDACKDYAQSDLDISFQSHATSAGNKRRLGL